MPKASKKTIELMRQRGYISIVEAARRTGHACTTLYHRIEKGTLAGTRSGLFHFVKLDSLETVYPHIVPPATGKTEAA